MVSHNHGTGTLAGRASNRPTATTYGDFMEMRWSDDTLTVIHDTQTSNATSGGLDTEVHGQITLTGEEWLHTAVAVLTMLPGKRNPKGTGYLLGPADADPDMIDALIAAILKDMPPFKRH